MGTHRNKLLNRCLVLGSILLLAPLIWCLTPSVALAYDFDEGAKSLLSTVKYVLIIAILVVAALAFVKREISRAIAAVIIGAVIIAVADLDEIIKLGKGVLSLFSGE